MRPRPPRPPPPPHRRRRPRLRPSRRHTRAAVTPRSCRHPSPCRRHRASPPLSRPPLGWALPTQPRPSRPAAPSSTHHRQPGHRHLCRGTTPSSNTSPARSAPPCPLRPRSSARRPLRLRPLLSRLPPLISPRQMKADASSVAPKSLVADSQTVIKAVEASLEQQLKLMRQLADLEFDAGLVGQRPLASPSPHPANPHLAPLPCLSPRPRPYPGHGRQLTPPRLTSPPNPGLSPRPRPSSDRHPGGRSG